METKDMMDTIHGWYTLEISGDLDLYSAQELLKKTLEILQQRITHFHIDCSRVHYLDSSGVGTIIKTLQEAKARGIKMTFSGIQGTPRKVLSMANILPILTEATPPQVKQST
uniref:Anti-sigma factor antagonist n=1 Tax=Gracilinema caldarium TaxID=215591 RepID=A0A7C3EG40_9SPIR